MSTFSSEGIQIGNVCSAAGVVGSWAGATHEDGTSIIEVSYLSNRATDLASSSRLGDPAGELPMSEIAHRFALIYCRSLLAMESYGRSPQSSPLTLDFSTLMTLPFSLHYVIVGFF